MASRREEVNLIAAIEGKRRKNYQTVNERRLLNSLRKQNVHIAIVCHSWRPYTVK